MILTMRKRDSKKRSFCEISFGRLILGHRVYFLSFVSVQYLAGHLSTTSFTNWIAAPFLVMIRKERKKKKKTKSTFFPSMKELMTPPRGIDGKRYMYMTWFKINKCKR